MTKWGVEQRLEFIEFRLLWEGGVNRSDIIDTFDVSVPQASKDLSNYQDSAPQNAVYDKSAKRYVAGPHFAPRFLKPDSDLYLARLRSLAEGLSNPDDSWIGQPPQMDIAFTPHRAADPGVLKALLGSIRAVGSVEVRYQSMNKDRPDPMWRRITPHAFGYDGFRWHTRAFCHIESCFKDFLLPRILDCRAFGEPGLLGNADDLWQKHFTFELIPHPKLTETQRAVVAKDYGMVDGACVITVRYAMLFYVLKRLGLLNDARKEDPRRQHIVVLDHTRVRSALKQAESTRKITEKKSFV